MSKRTLAVAVVTLLALPCLALGAARKQTEMPTYHADVPGARSPVILFYDDMEIGVNGWTHVDNTVSATPKFHLDTYMAFDGVYSWWCGELNASFAGGDGYANGWDQRLRVPATDVSAATYPIFTFAYRFDSEPGYDFTYVQAESLSVYRNLNQGYNGSSGGWQDIGTYGFILAPFDNPANLRFRFVSDGAWSDADGLYDSDGGAFHCDNVKIFDFFGGTVYFLDDCESGGLCIPEVPGSAGDFWHQITRACPAYSDPTSWWCGDDADTSLIPPNLNNSLISPEVAITGATDCTLRFLLHAEVPTVDNDYWDEAVSTDGGATWYSTGSWWGDFASCSGWGVHGIQGVDIGPYLPGTSFRFMLTFFTTDNGCGPGEAGGAGIMLDDTWLEDWTQTPVQPTSWGKLKALFR